MKCAVTILFSILFLHNTYGQKNADCDNAVVLDGLNIQVNGVSGYGEKLEFQGNSLGNKMYFTEEHNTVWMKFKAPYDGQLIFDLVPDSPTDDWDFMLFRAKPDQCAEIVNKTIQPIRSNLARNDPKTHGKTGLSIDATAPYEPAGIHPNYSKWLEVNEGWEFIMVVDINENSDNGLGFNMSINPWNKEEVHIETPHEAAASGFVDMTESHASLKMIPIKFQIIAEESGKPVACNAEVIGVNWMDSSISFTSKSEFELSIPDEEWFYVNVKKEGRTFSTEKYKARKELSSEVQKIMISEMKTGSHIILKEIVFRENTTHMLPSSYNALEQLIQFMKEYPTAAIEIQGHVNAPGYENDGKVKRISEKRAEQIKVYLVDSGIQGSRIKVKGMGNEFMIYDNPQTYEEEKANRRVEIEILKL